ncbi:uncharacterized protein [Mytilus edulis]|uniref:uncharacterized protein n=1 Tax=Mytilus edulis TaxID=6550 RepID=UPI0039EE9753
MATDRRNEDCLDFGDVKRTRSTNVAQLTKLYNELKKNLISYEKMEHAKQLYSKLCERFEQFKLAHLQCLDLCTQSEVIANLEVNYERCHENFVELRDRFSQYIASEKSHEEEIPEERDTVSIDSRLSSRSPVSSQSRFRSAKAKRLIAELKLRKLSEQHELERAQIEIKFRQQYCRGEAKCCIEDCALLDSDEGCKRARAILYSRYGRPHVIARTFIEKLEYDAQIKASNIEGLTKLALEMQKCEITLSQLGFNSDIDNSEILRCIVKRLPMHTRTRWVDIAHSISESGREPRFSDLAKFVDEKSRIASSMYGYDLCRENNQNKTDNRVNIIIMIQLIVSWSKPGFDHAATQPSVNCASTKGSIIKNCLGIIPVLVKGRNGNSCKTFALLDYGADKTLCDERLLQKLNIASKPVTFEMSIVSSSGSTIHGQEVDLQRQLEWMWASDFDDRAREDKNGLSIEDKEAMKMMESSLTQEDGHFKLGLPWRDRETTLPNNMVLAHARLQQLKRKLSSNETLHKMYTTTVNDYIEKGYVKEMTNIESKSKRIYLITQ